MLFLWGFLAGVAATIFACWLAVRFTPDEPDEAVKRPRQAKAFQQYDPLS